MGLFEIQRRIAADARAKEKRAAELVADVRPEDGFAALMGRAWDHVRDPVFVARLYEAAARKEPAVALALARWRCAEDDRAAEAQRALIEEQRALIAPLIASELFGPAARRAAAALHGLGDARVVPLARALAASEKDEDQRLLLAEVVAVWGDADDCKAAAAWLPPHYSSLAATLARRRVPKARAALVSALTAAKQPWRVLYAAIDAIASAEVQEAVPALLQMLATPCSVHALRALGKLGDPAAREPARAFLRQIGGTQPERTWAYRIAAESCLSALGEPQPLDTARAALAQAYPRRYGYPNLSDLVELQVLAAEALVDRGDDTDRERVARFATSHYKFLRALGLRAHQALGRPAPRLRWLDRPHAEQLLAREGPAALIAALRDPWTVYPFNAAELLAEGDDPAGHHAALDWALGHLESCLNHPVSYYERNDLDTPAAAALDVVRRLWEADDSPHRPRIAASTSRWIRAEILGDKPAPEAPPLLAGPWRARARRLDHAPFVFGRQINGLALDRAGARLAVVGDELGQIVDARTGAPLVALALEYRWAYDCAFAPDDGVLAVAYHGGHLVLFDPATGARVRQLAGFGGVPDGVKRLAFSPDGELLAAAGSDGRARLYRWRTGELLWGAEGEGSFEALAFSRDGTTCLFSHVKTQGGTTDYLLALDVRALEVRRVDAPASIWALAQDGEGWLAGGAAKQIRRLDAALALKKKALAQAKVVRLALAGEVLYAASESGELRRWELREGTSAELPVAARGPLWALCVAPDGAVFAAGKRGEVLRYDPRGRPAAALPGAVHRDHVTGLEPLADGGAITCGWEGSLLRWPPSFGAAALLLQHEQRLTCIALTPDQRRVFAGAEGRVFAVDLPGGAVRVRTFERGRVEDLALRGDLLVAVTSTGDVLFFDAADLEPRATVHLGGELTSLAFLGDDALLVGTGGGALVELGRTGEVRWKRAEHGCDLIDKDPYGSPHRDVVGIAVHGQRVATAGNDGTLRVFAGGRRQLRLLTELGLFNTCDFSSDGKIVASTSSHGLAAFDAASGETLVCVHVRAFPGADELTLLRFLGPRRALVGAENGALFEITLEDPT